MITRHLYLTGSTEDHPVELSGYTNPQRLRLEARQELRRHGLRGGRILVREDGAFRAMIAVDADGGPMVRLA